jgi:hypothetical protein
VEAEIKQQKKKKGAELKIGNVGANANSILQQPKLYTTYAELSALLSYHQVKGVSGMKKDAIVAKRKEILDSKKAALACKGWSDKDERRLIHLTSQPIILGDTALGRHQEVIKQQLSDVITKMSREGRRELKHKLESMEEM